MRQKLCHINELDDPGSRGFELERDDDDELLFLIKKDDQIYAYKNKCPHAGVNLEWQPDEFLDQDKALIQCSMHGALFMIESGQCVSGPCYGDHLDSIQLEIDEQGDIYYPADKQNK
ncbi:MAG: Rieske (2Fe-2S) protein [Gammaproteobacteria bacterium]